MHGEGCRRCQVQLRDLLPHIPRDERDGRLHFWHDALGFLNALQAARAEPFVLGDRTNLLDVRLDSSGHEWAVSTYPAVEIDKMVVVADATDALGDVLTLLSEALLLTTGRFQGLLGLLQAHRFFWGAAPPALGGLVVRTLLVGLDLFELNLGCAARLVCRPLFRGHGA